METYWSLRRPDSEEGGRLSLAPLPPVTGRLRGEGGAGVMTERFVGNESFEGLLFYFNLGMECVVCF